jgi:ribonuclease HII
VAGVDEAGCGALAGPVVAAAVVLPPNATIAHLTDSKRLSPSAREYLYRQICQSAVCWSVALGAPELVDQINIYQARLWAMSEAVQQLQPAANYVLVDGHVAPPLPVPCEAVIGGDGRHRVIAAASIIAKVTRDMIMERLDTIYPDYGFVRHKGYATRVHLRAIAKHGPCVVHRRTFAPIAASNQQQMDYS